MKYKCRHQCGNECLEDIGLPAYKLLKDIPGLPAGTIFLYDEDDNNKGSIGAGCLKNAWFKNNCQAGWCAETHVFPGQLIKDEEWFEKIINDGSYTTSP